MTWRPAAVRVVAVLAAAPGLLAGCSPPAASGAPATPAVPASSAPAPGPVRSAASAGGACHLLDYAVIREQLGLDFEVAVARSSGDTLTCVVRAVPDPVPHLALTVTPTTVDVPTFVEDLTPDGADPVAELGKAAYQGPGLEVAWLSGDDRLLVLALTVPDGATAQDHADLLALARAIDRARI